MQKVENLDLYKYNKLKNKILSNSKMPKNKCVRDLKTLPTSSCVNGLAALYPDEYPNIKPCPFYVLSKDSHFCFWAYHRLSPKNSKTGPDDLNVLEEIALLLNMTTTEVFNIIEKSKKRLGLRFKTAKKMIEYGTKMLKNDHVGC